MFICKGPQDLRVFDVFILYPPRLFCSTTFKVPARQSASNLSQLEINYERLEEM